MKPTGNGHRQGDTPPVLITGGTGFIGTNLADRLLRLGHPVILLDNFSRPGVERNWQWLRTKHGNRFELVVADVRDAAAVCDAVSRASAVFHLAAQVAVTTSLLHPVTDLDINIRGTVNVLEAVRALPEPIPVIYTSTNKVYGGLHGIDLEARAKRYIPIRPGLRRHGIDESQPLDFHSPYGCSKGAAAQYVADYARSFGLPTVVFRMSCIYGPHQCGTSDQGWVAHFLVRALRGQSLTIYGNGKQVRDLLFVDDLVDAFLLARQHVRTLSGQSFNIGGGPARAASLLEVIGFIQQIVGHPIPVTFDDWRIGDQRYYVSDTGAFQAATGWKPRVNVQDGLERLAYWLQRDGGIWQTLETPLLTRANGRAQLEKAA